MAGTASRATARENRSSRASRRAAAMALVDICRGQPPALRPEPDMEPELRAEIVAAAQHHRVAPLAHVRLREVDGEIAERLRDDRDSAKTMYLSAAALLGGLDPILDGIPWLTFKGPVLSEHAHPAPGLRSFSDVDVLVAPAALRAASSRLLDAGWTIVDLDDMLRSTPGQMHWMSPAGVLLDLHWSMVNITKGRQLFSVPTAQLLANRVTVPVGLASAWTLAPPDALVHVCLHAAVSGADRMLLLLDADQLARQVEDWDEVIRTAREWKAALAVSLVLSRARHWLGTPLPPGLHHSLGSSAAVRAATRATDRLSAVPRLRANTSVAALVARSVRPRPMHTLATIGRYGAKHLLRGAGQGPARAWHGQSRADAASLETYLRAVETEAEQSR